MRRVLIVDDDKMVVTSIAHVLKHHGLCPVTAVDWVEAVEAVTNDPPDVILLDMHMPRVDGAACLRFIRDQGSTIPVIVVSAFIDEELRSSLIGLKVFAFVDKPFESAELQRAVDHVLLPDVPKKKGDAQGETERLKKGNEAPQSEGKRRRRRKRRRRKEKKLQNYPIVYVGVGLVCLVLTGLLGWVF